MTEPTGNLYAVAGVTGNTGRAAAETLLERGARVRVVVRAADKGKDWEARGAEVAVADLGDSAALAKALRGADGAYLLTPADPADPDLLGSRAALVDAMAQAVTASGVPHVALLSSIGAQHDEGTGVILTARQAEKTFGGLATAVTFVRAAYFMENWASVLPAVSGNGVLPTMWSPTDGKIPQVATRDIGRVAAEALLAGPRGKRVIELAGPEELSAEDVAAALAPLAGGTVKVEPVPAEAQVETFKSYGVSERTSELFHEMYRGIENGKVDWAGGNAEFVRGDVSVGDVLGPMLG